ncbi:MAG: GNAT family N-acetyltransferase [Acidimicrobiales bacterium]
MDIQIERQIDDHGDGRYALVVDGKPAGELDFRSQGGRRVFTHTGVREEFEGNGLAGKLARRALDDARSEGLEVVPLCPFVASYLERHPDDQDLVDEDLYAQLRR